MTPGRAAASHWMAILALDDQALARGAAAAVTPAGSGGAEAHDGEGADPALGWLGLMRGDAATLEARLPGLFSVAAASRDPGQVIEVTALRAMVLSSLGKAGEALVFARRASLMSRTEAVPDAELLANLVLARMRRHAGKPHLAVRILDALVRLMPDAPRHWLEWERLLAGGTSPGVDPVAALQEASAEMTPAGRAGRRLLRAARAANREGFEGAADELLKVTAGWRDLQDEARALIELLDADRDVSDSLRDFRHGRDEVLRYGLFGARVVDGEQEPGISIFAVARPGEQGRRILVDGLGTFGPCKTFVCDEGSRRTHGRTDAGLAALVLAGPSPWHEAEFFRRVYGFAYSPGTHRGVLDVLLHRMRKRIGPSGAIVRADGSLVVALREPIAVADPRCAPPAAARILSALARQPVATADAVAVRLGITVRAAQMALQQLVSDGACVARRTGRHLEFQLRDSTFHEPTDAGEIRRGDSDPDLVKPG